MKPFNSLFISSLVIVSATFAQAQPGADASFSGTWKLNLARSQLSGMVYTFEKKPSGQWHYSGGGFDADFDLAGNQYTMPSGAGVATKEVTPTSWEITFYMAGKVTGTSRVSLRGDSLLWANENVGADGKTTKQTSTDSRVSGGPGFAGKWRSGAAGGSSTTLQIKIQGNDITVSTPEFQQTTKASFDGKDYPSMQAGQATKFTNAFSKAASNTIKMTTKMGGKTFATDVWSLSADGKVLTIESTLSATNEKTKSVFERQ